MSMRCARRSSSRRATWRRPTSAMTYGRTAPEPISRPSATLPESTRTNSRALLADLVETTPASEAKWFAAAKDAGLYDEALDLAGRAPCDPRTLTRAARDLGEEQPSFALGAGLLAPHWLVQGHGYEITGADVWAAYWSTM